MAGLPSAPGGVNTALPCGRSANSPPSRAISTCVSRRRRRRRRASPAISSVAARRGSGWQAELALSGRYRHLRVRGRADGYDAAAGVLEEVKTHRGDLARVPENHRQLHWAQLRVYGWLLCQQQGLAEIGLSLVYFDIATQRETALHEIAQAADLQRHFEQLCDRFLDWAAQQLDHRQRRDAALGTLAFPHADFRGGQRLLSTAVYNAARSGRCLLAQAPTGIGKTVGTLFPLLKACPGQALDKIYFLTAKGPGRRTALDALARIGGGVLPLRVAELVARDKACEHPDKACHGDSCPLASGFYDRLPAARQAAADMPMLDAAALRDVAAAHAVCPYYLGQEMTRWADVVVGDYNHYFDAHAALHALASAAGWRVAVLVDEAHNLVERARAMYSAELDPAVLREPRRAAPAALRRPLDRLQRAWRALDDAEAGDYRVCTAVPAAFATALQQASAAVGDHLAEAPAQVDGPLLQLHFDLLQFGRLIESFGEHSLFDIRAESATGAANGRRALHLGLRNIVPAPFLAPRFAAAHASVLFSATLAPLDFYGDILGLPATRAWVDVPSPFRADQLTVRLARRVSTRFRHREASLAPIARLMAEQFAARPGNYLAFFSSFDYLEQVAARFAAEAPQVPVWQQSRRMDEAARSAFLARFAAGSSGIGFAVLGGAFAEGIDLPGERLIGAFVATLGLPQVNAFNEAMRQRLGRRFGAGYDYAYLYPGIRKVVQAAGRVIRTPEDRGVVHLIDDRFARPEVLRLLPSWWKVEHGAEAAAACPGGPAPAAARCSATSDDA